MTPDELRTIICQEEGLKLDFKQKYYLNRPASSSTADQQRWTELINGQWDELIKDVISLANGNVGTANQVGRLIIGAGDELQPDGTRELFEADVANLASQQIMSKVNDSCLPRIPNITCEHIMLDGKTLCVITIPPTPYLHETNRQLNPKKGHFNRHETLVSVEKGSVFSEYTAFIRKGSHIFPAANNERRALESEKGFDLISLNENLKNELVNNLKKLLSKIGGSVISPEFFYLGFKQKYELSFDGILNVEKKHLKRLHLAVIIANGASAWISTQFLDYAIQSGKYLKYNNATGSYEQDEFLEMLYKLQVNIRRHKIFDEGLKPDGFLSKYNLVNSGEFTRVECIDVLPMVALLDRIADVINISAALVKYLSGDMNSLKKVYINDSSPIQSEVEQLKAEMPTEEEVVEWISENIKDASTGN